MSKVAWFKIKRRMGEHRFSSFHSLYAGTSFAIFNFFLKPGLIRGAKVMHLRLILQPDNTLKHNRPRNFNRDPSTTSYLMYGSLESLFSSLLPRRRKIVRGGMLPRLAYFQHSFWKALLTSLVILHSFIVSVQSDCFFHCRRINKPR